MESYRQILNQKRDLKISSNLFSSRVKSPKRDLTIAKWNKKNRIELVDTLWTCLIDGTLRFRNFLGQVTIVHIQNLNFLLVLLTLTSLKSTLRREASLNQIWSKKLSLSELLHKNERVFLKKGAYWGKALVIPAKKTVIQMTKTFKRLIYSGLLSLKKRRRNVYLR